MAKGNAEVCKVLITIAKILASSNTLRIVLISSEGSIMPFLEELSAANRALIYEVDDLTEEEAVKYLVESGDLTSIPTYFLNSSLFAFYTC